MAGSLPSTTHEQIEGVAVTDIPLRPPAEGDTVAYYDVNGCLTRSLIDDLGGAGGTGQTGIESQPVLNQVANLSATPAGPVVGVTAAGQVIRETSHFTRSSRQITIISWGNPPQPFIPDGDVTWIYPIVTDPDLVQENVSLVNGRCSLSSVPATPVIGFAGGLDDSDAIALRQDSHFTVDAGGEVTVLNYGTPAIPYAPDGPVTWIYSTNAPATGGPGGTDRTTIALTNTDATEVDTATVECFTIEADNTNDSFTLLGDRMVRVVNRRNDLKTVEGVGISGLESSWLIKVNSVWQES